MNEIEILKTAIEERNISKTDLAAKLGYKRTSSVTNVLTGDRKVLLNNFCKMLNAIGYDVVVRDQYDKKKEWVVEAE